MGAPPPACAVALKEWASVLVALERGDQMVLVRKGGLSEPGRGFALQAEWDARVPRGEPARVLYLTIEGAMR